MRCTSLAMALATLMPLPFIIVAAAYRIQIRYKRRAWGVDDWAMLAIAPLWAVSVVGLVGMAWSGVGVRDSSLSYDQQATAYFWFYIFQEAWCFTLVAIKWSLGFTLVRIAGGLLWVEVVIYLCLAVVTLGTGSTGMYLFFQCTPVQKNWYSDMPGSCEPRVTQTALSYMVAGISITTDWIFAIMPIVLLWNLNMKPAMKLSLIALLSLGVFASVAPLVRLKYLLGMNDASRFLENLSPILAWAAAEANVGILIANLPACRPVLESMFAVLFPTRNKPSPLVTSGLETGQSGQYLELDPRGGRSRASATKVGAETRLYGSDMEDCKDEEDIHEDGGQRWIIPISSWKTGEIMVRREFRVTMTGTTTGARQ